jgi:hypothetical protein
MLRKLDDFVLLGGGGATPALLNPLETADLNYWITCHCRETVEKLCLKMAENNIHRQVFVIETKHRDFVVYLREAL